MPTAVEVTKAVVVIVFPTVSVAVTLMLYPFVTSKEEPITVFVPFVSAAAADQLEAAASLYW